MNRVPFVEDACGEIYKVIEVTACISRTTTYDSYDIAQGTATGVYISSRLMTSSVEPSKASTIGMALVKVHPAGTIYKTIQPVRMKKVNKKMS